MPLPLFLSPFFFSNSNLIATMPPLPRPAHLSLPRLSSSHFCSLQCTFKRTIPKGKGVDAQIVLSAKAKNHALTCWRSCLREEATLGIMLTITCFLTNQVRSHAPPNLSPHFSPHIILIHDAVLLPFYCDNRLLTCPSLFFLVLVFLCFGHIRIWRGFN